MADEDRIIFRCTLCPPGDEFEKSNKGHVKRHVTKSKSGRHKDRRGDDVGVIEEIDPRDKQAIEDNKRDEEEGKEQITLERNGDSYTGPARGVDATMQNIGDRPVKDTGYMFDVQEAYRLVLDEKDILEILNADISKSIRRKVLRQIAGVEEEE